MINYEEVKRSTSEFLQKVCNDPTMKVITLTKHNGGTHFLYEFKCSFYFLGNCYDLQFPIRMFVKKSETFNKKTEAMILETECYIFRNREEIIEDYKQQILELKLELIWKNVIFNSNKISTN